MEKTVIKSPFVTTFRCLVYRTNKLLPFSSRDSCWTFRRDRYVRHLRKTNDCAGAVMAADLSLICQKKDGKPMSDLERSIASAMIDMRNSSSEYKTDLRECTFNKAVEIEAGGKKNVVIYVPVPQLRMYRGVQEKLTRELEKKLGNKYVMFIAWRRILPKPQRGKPLPKILKQKRPRSRTMNSVHEAILSDLVFPSEIVGKRARVRLDGKRLLKVHLDKNKQTNIEHKIEAIGGVYKKLTGKDVTFLFPDPIF